MIKTRWQDEADRHRAKSAQAHQRSADSFERCDTDGFLSQWASDMTGRLESRLADICENEGRASFWGLYDGDRRVAAKQFTNQYGTSWVLHDDEVDHYGRRFIPTGARSRIQKKLGLSERREWAPAWAKVMGSGTGLSGAASCYIGDFRTGDKWGRDAELIEEEAT